MMFVVSTSIYDGPTYDLRYRILSLLSLDQGRGTSLLSNAKEGVLLLQTSSLRIHCELHTTSMSAVTEV